MIGQAVTTRTIHYKVTYKVAYRGGCCIYIKGALLFRYPEQGFFGGKSNVTVQMHIKRIRQLCTLYGKRLQTNSALSDLAVMLSSMCPLFLLIYLIYVKKKGTDVKKNNNRIRLQKVYL